MWLVHRRRNKRRVNRTFRSLQLVSAAAFSLGHGANDAQKTMGIIAALLVGANKLDPSVLTEPDSIPLWIVLSCHIAIALGTMFGGWRIVRTMGNKLTRLQPMGGVCAESSAAATLFFASFKGIPVSTTHTITGAIVGVGSANRMSAVNWNVASRVVWAWVFTIPGAASVAMVSYWFVETLSR
jgi:PiT family inorganic phosphate transporter